MPVPFDTQSGDLANRRISKIIGVVLLVLTSYLIGLARGRTDKRAADYAALRAQYEQLDRNYSDLKVQYNEILREYPILRAQYQKMEAEYGELKSQYDRIERQRGTGPSRD